MEAVKEGRTSISLMLEPGKTLAIIGAKASGKSTLCKLISSSPVKREFQRGVFIHGKPVQASRSQATAHLLDIEETSNLLGNLSVAENIFLDRQFTGSLGRINWSKLFAEAEEIMTKLGVHGIACDAEAKDLSLLQKILVVICKLYARGTRIFVIDEITKFLSVFETECLLAVLTAVKGNGASLVYVPYRIEELPAIANQVMVLFKGEICGEVMDLANTSYEQIINVMMGNEQDSNPMADRFIALYSITDREMEVITLVAQGCSNEDIADRLHISLGTVKNHLHNVFRKTGVRNRMELCNLLKLR